jgi:predicted MFS family arabinose efflux permease
MAVLLPPAVFEQRTAAANPGRGALSASWPAIILVLLFGVAGTAIVPQAVPIVQDIIRRFPASSAYAGWLISMPSAICGVGALLAGILVDRIGDRRMLLGGSVFVVAGDVGVYFADSIGHLITWRLVEGVGYLAIAVGGATMLMRMTEGSRRKAALALWSAHTPIGFALSLILITPLAGRGEIWRWSFAGHGALVGVLAILGWLALHPANESGYKRGEGTGTVLKTWGAYRLGFASLCCALLTGGVVSALAGALGTRFGLQPAYATGTAVFDLALNALAAFGLAAALQRGFRVRLVAIVGTVLVAVSWAVYFRADSPWTAVLAATVFCTAMGAVNALIWGLLPTVTPEPRASGATSGLVTQATYIGVLLGPPVVFAGIHDNPALLSSLVGPGLMVLLLLALPMQQNRTTTAQA